MGDFEQIQFAYVSGTRQVMPDDGWSTFTRPFDRTSSDSITTLGHVAGTIIETTGRSQTDEEFTQAIVRFAEAAEPPITPVNNSTFAIAALGARASRDNTSHREAQIAADSLAPRVDYSTPPREIDSRGVAV
jgi:hypothetical protein